MSLLHLQVERLRTFILFSVRESVCASTFLSELFTQFSFMSIYLSIFYAARLIFHLY